jgi:hypothetical protein
VRSTWRTLTDLLKIGVIALVAAAILQELGTPAEKRTWHGKITGFIPYDLRTPTWERVRGGLWNPDDHRILTESVFGVGWTVNFHALLQSARRDRAAPEGPQETSR